MATIVPVSKKAKGTELNDYRPIALTSVIMKGFERLVKNDITSTLPDTLEALQFSYRTNRSTDDAIVIALHTALSHLDRRNTYVSVQCDGACIVCGPIGAVSKLKWVYGDR